MSNFSGRVPLNLIKDREALQKAVDGVGISGITESGNPSYRYPIDHYPIHQTPYGNESTKNRAIGNPMARRYASGLLDYDYLMHQVIDVFHKVQDGEYLNVPEAALLALAMPELNNEATAEMAPYLRLSEEEKVLLREKVSLFLRTEANWQAGQGGGTVPGAQTVRVR